MTDSIEPQERAQLLAFVNAGARAHPEDPWFRFYRGVFAMREPDNATPDEILRSLDDFAFAAQKLSNQFTPRYRHAELLSATDDERAGESWRSLLADLEADKIDVPETMNAEALPVLTRATAALFNLESPRDKGPAVRVNNEPIELSQVLEQSDIETSSSVLALYNGTRELRKNKHLQEGPARLGLRNVPGQQPEGVSRPVARTETESSRDRERGLDGRLLAVVIVLIGAIVLWSFVSPWLGLALLAVCFVLVGVWLPRFVSRASGLVSAASESSAQVRGGPLESGLSLSEAVESELVRTERDPGLVGLDRSLPRWKLVRLRPWRVVRSLRAFRRVNRLLRLEEALEGIVGVLEPDYDSPDEAIESELALASRRDLLHFKDLLVERASTWSNADIDDLRRLVALAKDGIDKRRAGKLFAEPEY